MVQPWSTPADALNRLLRRCVECPTNVQPSCPSCPADQACSLQPASCSSCASMVCVPIKSIPTIENPTQQTPIGGIVGGVVGGIVVILLITFGVWYFCIRRKKRQDLWEPPEKTSLEGSGTQLTRAPSIASTVMTRASNVIQIAYIPGVTVRSAPESPEIPPPMPSIPSTYTSTYTGTSQQTTPDVEQHFFMPKRDSVWSDTSSMAPDPRISIAPSLARETIYQENAMVPPIPAQIAFRAQANAVSVARSGSNTPSIGTTSGSNTPQVPQGANTISGSSIVARNVTARPIELKKTGSGLSGATLGTFPKKSASRRATPVPTISDEKEVVLSSPASTMMSDSPLLSAPSAMQKSSLLSFDNTSISGMSGTSAVTPSEGALGSASTSGRPTTAYTQAMIQEAMFRATQDSSHAGANTTAVRRPELKKHDSGPFSDSNEFR